MQTFRNWSVTTAHEKAMDARDDFFSKQVYGDAGLDPTLGVPTPELAMAILGERCIHRVDDHGMLIERDACSMANGMPIIHVPARATAQQINHRVACGLAEIYLTRYGYTPRERQTMRKRIAASICVPKPAFDEAFRTIGDDPVRLSERFSVSESLIVLRTAECQGYPTALRTEKHILVRGRPWFWPTTEQDWRELIRKAHVSGLVVRHLRDVRGRIALRAPLGLADRAPLSYRAGARTKRLV